MLGDPDQADLGVIWGSGSCQCRSGSCQCRSGSCFFIHELFCSADEFFSVNFVKEFCN